MDNYISVDKGSNLELVLKKNVKNLSNYEFFFINIYYHFNKIFFKKFIHFGEFYIEENISKIEILKIISQPSNIINKITIVEGWSQDQLIDELTKHFKDVKKIPYEDIIADTYYFENNSDFNNFYQKLKKIKKEYLLKFSHKEIYNSFSDHDVMTIGSLIEKEGLDFEDKRKISSVIKNRLNIGMKLQIDATVLYALTDGKYNLERKLLYNDLKIIHPYNTYYNTGLPPKPISYVGKKTIDIIFSNYDTDFLFYFFDNSLNRHIFSKSFVEHKKKLNDYRNNK